MKKYIIANLVYGTRYLEIFLNFHLKSLLDDSNLPSIAKKYQVEYFIYTDEETWPEIQRNKMYRELQKHCKPSLMKLVWPNPNVDRYNNRYDAQRETFRAAIKIALLEKALFTYTTADTYFGTSAFDFMLKKMEEGHDAVFAVPMRTAFESMKDPLMMMDGAWPKEDLFSLAYQHLNPLWVASHFESPQFTKLPFTILWNSGSGLLARSFSLSPMILNPNQQMAKSNQVCDVEIPSFAKKPWYAQDFDDCPIIGVEPLKCYYPPFTNEKASAKKIGDWARALGFSQDHIERIAVPFYYPNEATVKDLKPMSDDVVREIIQ